MLHRIPGAFKRIGKLAVKDVVNLAADVTGDLRIENFNGSTGASATTYWRGDGTWGTPAGGGGGGSAPDFILMSAGVC